MSAPVIPVDVWAAVSGPWCYIGHHRLKQALAAEPPGSVEVRPRAFELQPDLPPEGMATEDFYPRRFGSVAAMREAFERVTAEAAASGLELRYDRMTRAPNTRLAHRLVKIAANHGRATDALEALFRGHFREGADVDALTQAVQLVSEAVPQLAADDLCRAIDARDG